MPLNIFLVIIVDLKRIVYSCFYQSHEISGKPNTFIAMDRENF